MDVYPTLPSMNGWHLRAVKLSAQTFPMCDLFVQCFSLLWVASVASWQHLIGSIHRFKQWRLCPRKNRRAARQQQEVLPDVNANVFLKRLHLLHVSATAVVVVVALC